MLAVLRRNAGPEPTDEAAPMVGCEDTVHLGGRVAALVRKENRRPWLARNRPSNLSPESHAAMTMLCLMMVGPMQRPDDDDDCDDDATADLDDDGAEDDEHNDDEEDLMTMLMTNDDRSDEEGDYDDDGDMGVAFPLSLL